MARRIQYACLQRSQTPRCQEAKFPLIVGPHSSMQQQKYFSTSGMYLLETREPESQPAAVLAQGKLPARLELVQSGFRVPPQRMRDLKIRYPAKYPGAEVFQPGKHLT